MVMGGHSIASSGTGSIVGVNVTYLDDVLLRLGTDNDQVLLNRSATLAANTAVTDVLVGTVVGQALAANSLIISNITAAGDIALYGNRGGNSEQFLFYDTSAGILYIRPGQFDTQIGGAASTTNSRLLVENTSNAAAASHAYVEVSVGGTTSTGDPQFRWTIPGGRSWYAGSDNSDGADRFFIGTGTAVASNSMFRLDGATSGSATLDGRLALLGMNFTANNGATANILDFYLPAVTLTLAGTTQVTNPSAMIFVEELTIAQSGGAVTVNTAHAIRSVPVRSTTSVTLTDSSAFYVANGAASTGTLTNYYGMYFEGLTRGGTRNAQIVMANGGTEPTSAAANTAGFYCVDDSADNATIGIISEHAVAVESILASTHVWRLHINGTMYKVLLSNV